MSQIVSGINLGQVEGSGPAAAPTFLFRHNGAPSDNADLAVGQASAGSLYIRVDTAQLYIKGTDSNWTAITVP